MNIKSLAIVLALGVVGSASAVTVSFSLSTQTKGTFTSGSSIAVSDSTVLSSSNYSGPDSFKLTNLQYNFANTTNTSGTGTLTLVRTSDNAISNVALTFNAKYLTGPVSNSLRTTAGSVTLTGLDGFLQGYTGTGALSATLINGNMTDRTSFTGTLNPVPEPASMAALALGGLGLVRRRRKA